MPDPQPMAAAERALESDLKFLVVTEPGRARLRMLIRRYAAERALAELDDLDVLRRTPGGGWYFWPTQDRFDKDGSAANVFAKRRKALEKEVADA